MKYSPVLLFFFLSFSLSSQTFTNYTETEGLIDNSVNCVTVDADDNLWFGTQNGISKFDGTNWTSMDKSTHPGLADNGITAIFVDKDNRLWVGTDFGVSRLDGDDFITFTEADGLADNRVNHINQNFEGSIWISNKDGVTIAEEGSPWISLTLADGIPFGGIAHTDFGSLGRNYYSTPLSGIIIDDGIIFSTVSEDEGLVSKKVTATALAPDGRRWVSTSSGVSVLDDKDKPVANYTRIFELPAPDTLNPVEDVKVDSKGRVWAGVYVDYLVTEGGVSMFDGNTWVDYDVADGLVGPVVRQLAIDSKDDVWVATSSGVTKISFPSTNVSEVEEIGFAIFPNPVSDVLNVKFDLPLQAIDLKMYDAFGRLVLKMPISKAKSQLAIPVSGFSKGMYYLSVGAKTAKVILE